VRGAGAQAPAGCGQSPQTLRRSARSQAQRAPKVQDVRLCPASMDPSTIESACCGRKTAAGAVLHTKCGVQGPQAPAGCGQSPQTLRRSARSQAQRAPKVQDVRLRPASMDPSDNRKRLLRKKNRSRRCFAIKVRGAGASGPCRVWAEPANPAPQRPIASTASTEGARCATPPGKHGSLDNRKRLLRKKTAAGAVLFTFPGTGHGCRQCRAGGCRPWSHGRGPPREPCHPCAGAPPRGGCACPPAYRPDRWPHPPG